MSTKPIFGGGAALVCREGCALPQPRRGGALLLRMSSPYFTVGERLPLITCRHLLASSILRVFLANHCSRVSSEKSHKILISPYRRA